MNATSNRDTEGLVNKPTERISDPPSFPRLRRSRRTKTPRDSAFLTRKIVSPDLLNPNGTLFGGVIMSWIDEVAFMSARRYSGRPFVVTASIDNITFLRPLRNGEHVILTSQVNYVGRTSMEIGVKVECEDPYSGERDSATSAYLTFVALDKRGRPTPVPELILETSEDHRRYDEAKLRVRVRERVRAHLKKKYSRMGARPESSVLLAPAIQALRPLYPRIPIAARGWWTRLNRWVSRV